MFDNHQSQGEDGHKDGHADGQHVDVGNSVRLSCVESPADVMTAIRFADCAAVISDLARCGSLLTPAFRSPPKRLELDRSIQRRGGRPVVAVRRRGRPAEAVEADLIEGVVVANDLDPIAAARFRSQAWAAIRARGQLDVLGHGVVSQSVGAEAVPNAPAAPEVPEEARTVPEQSGPATRSVPLTVVADPRTVTMTEAA